MPARLLYAPYLPLRDRTTIAGWEFIAVADVTDEEWASPETAILAAGLARLYTRPDRERPGGAFVQPPSGRVGETFKPGEIPPLRRALLAALLLDNPSRAELRFDAVGLILDGDHEALEGNAGWVTYTSEHAQLWGHDI